MYKLALTSLMMLAFAGTAHATIDSSSKKAQEHAALDVTGSFAEQRKAIDARLANGETYSEINQEDRKTVKEALDRMAAVLEQSGGVAALNEEQKVRVFNDQEVVNTILTRAADDSRLVCRREKRIGSNRPTTQCMTALQRREQLEEARKSMTQSQRSQL